MKNYAQKKSAAREKAIRWQYETSRTTKSYHELSINFIYFSRLAKRYGLIKEFRENGII